MAKPKFIATRPGGFRKLCGGKEPAEYHFTMEPQEVADEHIDEVKALAPYVTQWKPPERRKAGQIHNDWPVAALALPEGICGPLASHGVESVGDLKRLIATEGGLGRLFSKDAEQEILNALSPKATSPKKK